MTPQKKADKISKACKEYKKEISKKLSSKAGRRGPGSDMVVLHEKILIAETVAERNELNKEFFVKLVVTTNR